MATMSIVSEIRQDGVFVRWKLHVSSCGLANTFRRIILEEIPTYAIHTIEVYRNTSCFSTEYLAHRLGFVPFIQAPCQGTPSFELRVGPCRGIHDVLSKDLHGTLTPAIDRLLICRLTEGQELHLKAYAEKGVGREHVKWYPVSMVSYKPRDGYFDFCMETTGALPYQDILTQAVQSFEKYRANRPVVGPMCHDLSVVSLPRTQSRAVAHGLDG